MVQSQPRVSSRSIPRISSKKGSWLRTAGWALLLLLGAFYLLAPLSDLTADLRTGIPADHLAAFTALTGTAWAAAGPIAHYITTLEIGYAVHELVFGVLFLAIVLVPLRRGERWVWFACWAVLIAGISYVLTFGLHDPTILRQSLIAAIAVPVLLLTQLPYTSHQ